MIEEGNLIDQELVGKDAVSLNTGRFDQNDQKEAAGIMTLGSSCATTTTTTRCDCEHTQLGQG